MAARKRGGFARHASRAGNRLGQRARQFVNDARSGAYDQTRLAEDVGGTIMDAVDFWAGLFGSGASPSVGVANLGPAPGATYQAAGGVTRTVLLEDPVPDDAVWPVQGGGLGPALRLAPVNDPAAPVDLRLIAVTVEDEEGLQLRVTVRTVGGAVVGAGDYFGNLYFESATLGAGQYFAAVIRAVVT